VNNVSDAIEDAPNRDERNPTTATPVLSMEAQEEQARRARAMRFREDMFYDGVVSSTQKVRFDAATRAAGQPSLVQSDVSRPRSVFVKNSPSQWKIFCAFG